MDLGVFSVSLAVADLEVSRQFYEKLGFAVFGDDGCPQLPDHEERRHRRSGCSRGCSTGTSSPSTPGGTPTRNRSPEFTDVRDIQRSLKAEGLALVSEADEATTGPASFMLVDPDGNMILLDQHL